MFETAVIEIANNIVQNCSEEGSTICNLTLQVYKDRLTASFKDNGRTAYMDIDAAAMLDSLAESGRGLAIAKAAVDILTYERCNGDNTWTLIRTFRAH